MNKRIQTHPKGGFFSNQTSRSANVNQSSNPASTFQPGLFTPPTSTNNPTATTKPTNSTCPSTIANLNPTRKATNTATNLNPAHKSTTTPAHPANPTRKATTNYPHPANLTVELIKKISAQKNEPNWMTEYRLKAFEIFQKLPMPRFGPNLDQLNLNDITYYLNPNIQQNNNWEKIPRDIKTTFEKLGVQKNEETRLAGTGAQYESEMIYHSLKKSFQKQGVIFESIENGLKNHEKLFKEHFGKIVPSSDNKFAALNSAIWSGGSFIYIPKNIKLELPLHAYFRMQSEKMGQFERTLIIGDEGSSIHYIEGCTATSHEKTSLHAAVVEIILKKNARLQYSTIQNWSNSVFNLVTKRAFAYENAEMIWLDCNLGSKITMKYPAIFLMGKKAKGEIHSLSIASESQNQDTGAKIIHSADDTHSNIISKTIGKKNGISTYRGLIKTNQGTKNTSSKINCETLLLSKKAISNTYPQIDGCGNQTTIEHEALVSKISQEQLFYLKSRGLNEAQATSQIINGFAEPIIKKLPMEYALEMHRLMEMEFKNKIG